MRKVSMGVAVALLVGVGGYLGLDYWAQHAVAREVDAMLDGWRAGLGSATRGRVEFDLWSRTLKVTDVVVQSRSAPYPKITLAQVVASGIDLYGKAARVDIADLEVSDALPGQPGIVMRQKAPSVTLTGASARPLAPRKATSALDQVRLLLEQFSTITAASIEAPSLSVTVAPAAAMGARQLPPGAAEYTYTNLAMRDVREGRVAHATVDSIVLRAGVAGPPRELKGEIGKSSVVDADTGPLLAFLDRTRPKAQGYQRMYRQISIGPYALRFADGTGMSIDGIVAEDVGLRPDKLSLDDILFLTEVTSAPGGAASAGQAAMLLDKVAGLYEGLQLGKVELHGFSFNSRGGNGRLASLRLDRLANGRFGELSIDGLDGKSMSGEPFSFGRVAVKGFDVASFMRLVGEQAAPGQPPGLDRVIGMLNLVEGIELKGIAVPDPKSRQILQLETFDAAWGQFIGPVPSDARLSLKLSVPISAPDPEPFVNMLAGAGVRALTAAADLGVRWSEDAQTVALEPATLEIGGFLALSLKASVGNVRRDVFSADVVKVMGSAALAEVGPVEVTLRDLGLVDLAAAEVARAAGQGPEAGRTLLLEQWGRNAQMHAQTYPDAQPFFQAITQFLQGKGETLTLRLTPKGHVRMLQLMEAVRLDPAAALLAAFNVEARSGR